MWVIPTRGRPQNISRLLEAFDKTGATTPVLLRLDDDDKLTYKTPWTIEIGPRLPLSNYYNEAYQKAPDTPWWGFIGDDVVPETPGWDVALIKAAGSDGMAVPKGEGTPHFVLGGKLVQSVGWLALPGLDRLYIDTVWHDIAKKRGVLRYCPDVILRHHHFSNGKALFDQTYRKERKAQDKLIYETWRKHDYSS